jgi:hypothetical protein
MQPPSTLPTSTLRTTISRKGYVCQVNVAIKGYADVPLSNGELLSPGFTWDGCMAECKTKSMCGAFTFGKENGHCELWSTKGPTTAWEGAQVCAQENPISAPTPGEFRSSWNTIATDTSCGEITGMLLAGEISGNAAVEGIVIGYPSNMGKVREHR